MSRIIRSQQMIQSDNKKEIQIKDLFEPQNLVNNLDFSSEKAQKLSIEEVMAERERLIAEAQSQITLEKQQFEHFMQQEQEAFAQQQQQFQEALPGLQQQAYEEGFSKGFEDGSMKAEEQMKFSLNTANSIVSKAEDEALKYIENQEQVILELGIKSAERILGQELEQQPEKYVDIIKRALKEAREMTKIKVYIAPDFYDLVAKNRDELAEMFPPDIQFLIFVNEELTNNESYIETNAGRIVVSIDEQLQQLRIKLNEILDSRE